MGLEKSVNNLLKSYIKEEGQFKRVEVLPSGIYVTLSYMHELQERLQDHFQDFPDWQEKSLQHIRSLRGFRPEGKFNKHLYRIPLTSVERRKIKATQEKPFFPLSAFIDYTGPLQNEKWIVKPISDQKSISAVIHVLNEPLVIRKHALDRYHQRHNDSLVWKEEQLQQVHKELIGSSAIQPKKGKQYYCKKHDLEDIEFRLSKNGHVYTIGFLPGRNIPQVMTTIDLTPRYHLSLEQKKRYKTFMRNNKLFFRS